MIIHVLFLCQRYVTTNIFIFFFVYHLIVLIVLIQCILLLMYGGTVKPIQNIFMSNCTSFIREDKTKKNVVFCNLCKRSDESRNISTTLF